MINFAELRSRLIATLIRALVHRFFARMCSADFFLDSAAEDGTHACDYLLACDMEMVPIPVSVLCVKLCWRVVTLRTPFWQRLLTQRAEVETFLHHRGERRSDQTPAARAIEMQTSHLVF